MKRENCYYEIPAEGILIQKNKFLIVVTGMHTNTGLSDTADRETVMNATLDKFAEMFKNAIVIDDDIPIEKWMREYVKTCSSTESLCFYDCTSILDQYKTWFQIFKNIQPFYGSSDIGI